MVDRPYARSDTPASDQTREVQSSVFLVDTGRRVVLWGYDSDGLVEGGAGEACYRHIHGFSRPCGALDGSCPLEEVLRTGKAVTMTREDKTAGSESRKVRITILPVPSEGSGHPPLVVEVVDRPDTETIGKDKLVKLQRMATATNLANTAAHDFNNMLTAIIGRADMLLAKMDENHSFWRMMSGIQKTGERAAVLIRQLLRFTRQPAVVPADIRLNEIIDSMRETFPLLIGSEYEFKFNLGRDIKPFRADVTDIEQIAINLVLNACDAMPDGGTVIISTENQGETDRDGKPGHGSDASGSSDRYVCLSVKDEGAGITAIARTILFEPFGSSRKDSLGLGLFAARTMAEKVGGSISVEPGKDGKGSVASVRFPVGKTADVKLDRSADSAADKLIPRGNETLLLIEDVEEVRDLAKIILTDLGYSVLPAADGMQAIQLYETSAHQVDLVLADVVLPGMRGTEVYKVIKRRNPHQKVIFMSGYVNDKVLQDELGGKDIPFLPKPFSTADLARIVRRTIDTVAV